MYFIYLNCEFKVHVLVLNISKIKEKMFHLNIYFLLRFGLANAINDYQKLKIRLVCVENF